MFNIGYLFLRDVFMPAIDLSKKISAFLNSSKNNRENCLQISSYISEKEFGHNNF